MLFVLSVGAEVCVLGVPWHRRRVGKCLLSAPCSGWAMSLHPSCRSRKYLFTVLVCYQIVAWCHFCWSTAGCVPSDLLCKRVRVCGLPALAKASCVNMKTQSLQISGWLTGGHREDLEDEEFKLHHLINLGVLTCFPGSPYRWCFHFCGCCSLVLHHVRGCRARAKMWGTLDGERWRLFVSW